MNYIHIIKDLKKYSNKEKAQVLARFFKTGKGQYGEGDKFIGVVVPNIRTVVKKYAFKTDLKTVQKLLESEIHEYRLTGLLILVKQFEIGTDIEKKRIYNFYLKNTQYINNWDLVDLTAPNIVGAYLLEKTAERKKLYTLAKSKNLWKKRIAILATFTFIRNGEKKDTIEIAKILLHDDHDLIHKAVGWMLRELGKRVSQKTEEDFLKKHYKTMPRTMLRYAIEKFDSKKRHAYLKGTI